MKITKTQLRRIIAEEKTRILSEMIPDDRYEDPYMEAMHELYDALERVLAVAKKAGIDYPDLVTAWDDARDATGY